MPEIRRVTSAELEAQELNMMMCIVCGGIVTLITICMVIAYAVGVHHCQQHELQSQ